MKKTLLSLVMLTVISTPVLAKTPIANLKINGDIKPPTCTINGATQSDVIFDLGKISPSLIPKSSNYIYPHNTTSTNVTIECDANTDLTFKATDTYVNSQLDLDQTSKTKASGIFHLVNKDQVDTSVGGILFVWYNVTVDGKPAFISRANDATVGFSDNKTVIVKEVTNGWTTKQQENVDKNSLDLMPGQIFSTSISAGKASSAFILSKDSLNKKGIDISNGLDFIGEAVLTFNFGV
ncbi:TPA: fimbrial protein [Proteus mirabilis]|nr:fimbrial protein [Proteus mirabilis]MBI6316189.1 fimbrial protein [Proteus mirabilis]HEJ9418945.1 fimbrial protein [Proteus mirabilis]